MLNRRQLLITGLATLGVAASGAMAQDAAQVPDGLPPAFQPQIVSIQPGLPAGEIHVDPNRFALYWTLPDQFAIRYACGIGRPGLYEAGVFTVGAKREWPSWKPTPDMVERDPEIYRFVVTRPLETHDGDPADPVHQITDRIAHQLTATLHEHLTATGREADADRLAPVWGHGIVGLVRSASEHWLGQGPTDPGAPPPLSVDDVTAAVVELIRPALRGGPAT